MAFSPPEYCRLFAQQKAYQGGVTGTPGPPPSYAPETVDIGIFLSPNNISSVLAESLVIRKL